MKFTLTFTEEEIAVLDRALVARPYSDVAAIIRNIQAQIAPQLNATASPITGQAQPVGEAVNETSQ